MRALAMIVVAIIIGGLIGTLALRDPGYVMLAYHGHSVEMSLWFALILVVAAVILIRLLYALVRSIATSPRIVGRWNANRRLNGSRRHTEHGLLLLAEEEWSAARRSLVAGAPGSDAPLLNYLEAAMASNRLGEGKRRDDLLKKAIASTPGSEFAVDLARVRMQMDNGEFGQAIAVLNRLRDMAPRHQVVATLLARCHRGHGDMSLLEAELPRLKRLKKDAPEEFAGMQLDIARHKVFGALARDDDAPGAVAVWKRLDTSARLDRDVVLDLAAELLGRDATEAARDVLVAALGDSWRRDWLGVYAALDIENDEKRRQAQRWLGKHADDALLKRIAAEPAGAGTGGDEAAQKNGRDAA
ncbi:MAG: heme biosynthesis HemY N-terminal domain-containing protein [Pseudomonadota bacterium]